MGVSRGYSWTEPGGRNQGVIRRAQDGVADSGNGQVDHQRFSTFRVDLAVKPIVDRPTWTLMSIDPLTPSGSPLRESMQIRMGLSASFL